MLKRILSTYNKINPAPSALAHCDGPCGVYDPASARIAAEAVLSMTKKLLALEVPSSDDKAAYVKYHNTFARYVAIKEEEAHHAKEQLLVLWTDFFKPHHLETHPDLHDIFWKAAHPQPRFGQGAFRLAFEVLLRSRLNLLKAPPALIDMQLRDCVVQWGKPSMSTLRCAERRLLLMNVDSATGTHLGRPHAFWMVRKTLVAYCNFFVFGSRFRY